MNNQLEQINNDKKEMWDTTAITPGSQFMINLSRTINTTFENKFPNLNILISSSNNPGEGEHKIYEFIRDNKDYHRDTNTVIYGLDADLIML